MTSSRRLSTTTSTQDRIKEWMLQQGVRPGDPMPTEAELCDSIGVSRSSVREAVRTLTALDILEVRHGHGTFVGPLSLAPLVNGLTFRGLLSPSDDRSTLREVVEARTALDLGLAEDLAKHLTGTTNPDLHALVDRMVELSRENKSFADQDRLFHVTLLGHLPNTLVGQLVEAMWAVHATVTPRVGIPTPADICETAAAHGSMLAALEAGDIETYRKAVHQHYAPLLRVLER